MSETLGQRFGGQGGIHWYLKTLLYCLLTETTTHTHIFLNISIAFYSIFILFILSYHIEILFSVFFLQIPRNISVFRITDNLLLLLTH